MTSLERVKQFLQNNTRALALVAAPLAALAVSAVPAKAGVIFNTAACIVSASNATTSGSCSDSALPTQANGSNGIHMIGDATAFPSSGGGFSITMDWGQGSISGGPVTLMPFSYSFTPTLTNQGIASETVSLLSYTF